VDGVAGDFTFEEVLMATRDVAATSKGREFLNRHVQYLLTGDIAGMMENHYTEDCALVTFEFTVTGREAVGKYLGVDEPGKAGKIFGMDEVAFAESDDVIIFTVVVHSEKMGNFVARDALYLRDGKIARHIALTLPPDKDVKSQW
jgi:hypothetical protein